MENNISTDVIGVIGAGYVGLVAGACFSALGFKVGIVEVDPGKLETLKKGVSTIYEPGLTEILEDSLAGKRLTLHSSSQELFAQSKPEVIFIAVGTPERADGSCNLDYVYQAVKDVAKAATHDIVLVIKSTVPVGTARKCAALVKEMKLPHKVAIVNNPEFLKEGSAIADFMRPERVVLGGTDPWGVEKVKFLYESFLHNGHPLFVTEHETAELSKLASNLMLATRVSLINQVSRLASAVGADIKQVESVMRSDSRIGSKYLYAGLGYGGSCFPKDVKSFIYQCKERQVDASLAEMVDTFNDSQKLFFIPDIKKRFPKAEQTTIALWGVAFKPETDDIRESPALTLTEELVKAGYKVKVYDPKASHTFKAWLTFNKLETKVTVCESAQEAAQNAQALVLVTEWQEFQRFGASRLRNVFSGPVVYDGKNIFRPERLKDLGFEYVGVGRGNKPGA